MADALEMLGDDEEAGVGQKVMDIGDAAGDRILDRDHGKPRLATFNGGKRILEGGAGKRLHLGISIAASEMGIRAGLALIGDFLRSTAHDLLRIWRARARSAGVSTPSGMVSTRAT